MANLDPQLQSSIDNLQTRHTALVDAVRNYSGGSVADSTSDLIAAKNDVMTAVDTRESALLGLIQRDTTKPVPSLLSDFKTQTYMLGTRRLDHGVSVDDMWNIQRASSKWVMGPQGKLVEIPENEPAYHYDPSTGEALGVLIEESRTNLITGSESAWESWYNGGSSYFNVAFDDGVVPWMGNVDVAFFGPQADRSSFSTSVAFHNVGILDVGVYWLTGLFKARNPNGLVGNLTMRTFHRGVGGSSGSAGSILARLYETGSTFGSASEIGDGIFGETKVVECRHVGNGWYYYVERFEIIESGEVQLRLFPYERTSGFTGDGETGILRTRLQLEKGSSPSSYILTEDSPVTRAADAVGRTLGAEYSPYEWTVLVECDVAGIKEESEGFATAIASIGEPDRRGTLTLLTRSSTETPRGRIALSRYGDITGNGVGLDILDNVHEGVIKIAFSYQASTGDVRLSAMGFSDSEVMDFSQHDSVTPELLLNKLGRLDESAYGTTKKYRTTYCIPRALTETELQELTQ
ncbi:MAG: hypothetical protein L0L17_05995 [Yaniella sp.]|nr:hypothetical protein [Yaniella sp.]